MSRRENRYPLYRTWWAMMQRCYNPKRKGYHRWGGRGVRVCDSWHDYRTFKRDILRLIGEKPTPDHSLDRFPDNDGNYEPGNVRWATRKQQGRNTRRNHIEAGFGLELCLSAWAEKLNIHPADLWHKLRQGESIEDVVEAMDSDGSLVSMLEKEGESGVIQCEPYNPDDVLDFDEWEVKRFILRRTRASVERLMEGK